MIDTPIIPRSARLLSPASKGGGMGYSTALRFEPADKSGSRGLLYFAFDCDTKTADAELVKAALIDTIRNEYYKESAEGSAKAFESAIQAANDTLGELADKGNGEWVGKLSAVIACLMEDNIKLTKAGGAEAFLMRRDTVAQISEDLTDPFERPHPFKSFSNIAEGQLELGDKLVLTTPGLFYHVSVEELKNILTENNPSGTIAHLARLLEDEQTSRTSLLVVEISTPELVAHDFLPEGPSEIILQPGSSVFRVPVLSGIKTFTKEMVGDSFAAPVLSKASTFAKRGFESLPLKKLHKLSPVLSKIRKAPERPVIRKLALSAAVLLIVFTVGSAYRAPRVAAEKAAEESYAEAKAFLEDAKIKKIYDKKGALESVAAAVEANQDALAHAATAERAEELGLELAALSDELNGVVRLPEREFAQIPEGNWKQAFVAGSVLYLVAEPGRIIAVSEGKSETLNEKLPDKVLSAAYNPDGLIYLVLESGSIHTFDIKAGAVTEAAGAGTYQAVDSLSVNTIVKGRFLLYVLSEGRIYTHLVQGSGLGPRSNYTAVSGLTDINLDNAVYMLSGNSVVKYLNKRQVGFGLSEPLPGKANDLLTKGAIYLKTDSKLITHYRIDGGYMRQLPLENDPNLFAIGDSGEIYLITKDRVFIKK